jgi:hypothetical protein
MVRRCGVWLKAGGQQCCAAVHDSWQPVVEGCGVSIEEVWYRLIARALNSI